MKTTPTILLAALAFLPAAGAFATQAPPDPIVYFNGGSNSTDFLLEWTAPSGACRYDLRWSYVPFDDSSVDGSSYSWTNGSCPIPTPETPGTTQTFCATFCQIHCHAEIPIYWGIRSRDAEGTPGPLSPVIVLALHEESGDSDAAVRRPCGASAAGGILSPALLLLLALRRQTMPFFRSRRG